MSTLSLAPMCGRSRDGVPCRWAARHKSRMPLLVPDVPPATSGATRPATPSHRDCTGPRLVLQLTHLQATRRRGRQATRWRRLSFSQQCTPEVGHRSQALSRAVQLPSSLWRRRDQHARLPGCSAGAAGLAAHVAQPRNRHPGGVDASAAVPGGCDGPGSAAGGGGCGIWAPVQHCSNRVDCHGCECEWNRGERAHPHVAGTTCIPFVPLRSATSRWQLSCLGMSLRKSLRKLHGTFRR